MIEQGFELKTIKKIKCKLAKFYILFIFGMCQNWKIAEREISKFGISYLP